MEVEYQSDERKEDAVQSGPEQTNRNEKPEKDFFTKVLEDAVQDNEKKNIYIQYRIVNNHGIMANDSAQIETIYTDSRGAASKQEKKFGCNVFYDESQRDKWLTENYETYSMALLIAAAAFDAMPYMWVIRAADALYESFENKKDVEEKRRGITETLSQFGAAIYKGEINTYTGTTPTDIIRLEQKTLQETLQNIILKYIWIECPQLQDVIICWLEGYYMGKPLSMSKRAGDIMGKLACWDYHYFLNNMVNQIRYKKSVSTDMMIAQIVTVLDTKNRYHDNVCNLLGSWSKERNVHYLLAGLFVCAGQQDKNSILEDIISIYIDRTMEELQREREGECLRWIEDFFAAGVRAFTFYRILIEKIYGLTCNHSSPREIRDIRRLFWILFHIDIHMARYDKEENAILVRIAMQDSSTGKKLQSLWQLVWRDMGNREIFYRSLAEYDKRAAKMPDYSLERFIQSALGEICDKKWQIDICSKIRRRSGDE